MQWLNCAASIATIVAALVALWAVISWKRQYKYQREADVAGEGMVLAYQVRDAIKSVRDGFGLGATDAARPKFRGETAEQAPHLDDAYMPIALLARHDELFAKIRAHRYRMMLEFGPDGKEIFKEALDFSRDLFIAARRVIMSILEKEGRRRTPEQMQAAWDALEKIRWDEEENDAIAQGIDAMVKRLEKLVETHKLEKVVEPLQT